MKRPRCKECKKPIKTLYERVGAKEKWNSVAYRCPECGALYDKDKFDKNKIKYRKQL